jgi:hypothetical protein
MILKGFGFVAFRATSSVLLPTQSRKAMKHFDTDYRLSNEGKKQGHFQRLGFTLLIFYHVPEHDSLIAFNLLVYFIK